MATVLRMPKLSNRMISGILQSWVKKENEFCEPGDILAHIETDKAIVEYESPEKGFIRRFLIQSGDSLPVGNPIAIITDSMDEDIEEVLNSNEITSVINNLQHHQNLKAQIPFAVAENKSLLKQELEIEGEYEEIPISGMRRSIAFRLLDSVNNIPQFYVTSKIQMDAVIDLRQKLNNTSEVRISINDIIIKACGEALMENPQVNTRWTEKALIQFKNANISFAVATPEGLYTPIIKNVNQKTLTEITKKSKELTSRARNKKLSLEEYIGGTFGTSNLGMYGVDQFTAIINPPQSCLLAISAIQNELQFDKNENIINTKQIKMTLTCDHRVVDGAVGAKFMKSLKRILENPSGLANNS